MTLSNRCQVFDRFQDTISQHVVKVDFLNRIHKKHPPNRRVLQSVKRRSLKVSRNPMQAGWWSLIAFTGYTEDHGLNFTDRETEAPEICLLCLSK